MAMIRVMMVVAAVMAMAVCGMAGAARAAPEVDGAKVVVPAAAMPAPAPGSPGSFVLPDGGKVVEAFGKFAAERAGISAETKAKIARRVAEAVGKPGEREGVIVEVLQLIYPDFAGAMDLLANEKEDQAMELLGKMTGSEDGYLAANAKFFLARALVNDERYEEALPVVESLVGADRDKTLYAGQAMFLRGVCQAGLLKRKEAMESFKQFIKADAEAPERLVVGALHRMDELERMSDGTLPDVGERMDYSRRKLALEDSGEPTREQQKKVVSILDELIKKAEEKEKQGGGGGGGGGGNGQGQGSAGGAAGGPAGGAAQSTAPAGESTIGALHRTTRGDAGEQWGEARQRQRDEVLNAIKARYPERYRELVEQYYRALQEEEP
ncbi:MAG: tetratricopeptide repeat protein [Phycisphaerales bacterium]